MARLIFNENGCYFLTSLDEVESDIESFKFPNRISDEIGIKPPEMAVKPNQILVEVKGFFPVENGKLVFKPSLIFKRVI